MPFTRVEMGERSDIDDDCFGFLGMRQVVRKEGNVEVWIQ